VELVEGGGLPGVIEPDYHDLVLLGREHDEPHTRHPRPHPHTLPQIRTSRRGGWRAGGSREDITGEAG
jgi:hypothetical protein